MKTNAVAGGAAALVLSFIPFSQVLGGTVAGYLGHSVSGKSTRVGAVSGVLGVISGLLVIPFVMIGVALGAAAIGEQSITFLIGRVALGGLLFSAAIAAGFGALGGYASRLVADDGL